MDSTDEDTSTLDMTFAWRVLVLMTEEVCLSRKFSRNFTCSIIGLCVKRPPAVMSRHRSASMSRPIQKRHRITPSGNDMSGPACTNVENLSQAIPIDSFSHYSKSRTALGREPIRDTGKMCKENGP